jgi:hypothetical protein
MAAVGPTERKEALAMAWRLSGKYMENCNCATVCPCTTSELTRPADEERCLLFCAFHVGEGEIEGTDVSGLNVAAVFDAPRVMSEGAWRAGFIVDAAATDEQAGKLRRVFTGELGGPPGALALLVGDVLGIDRAPINYADGDHRHSVRIGDDVEIEIEDFVSPETGKVLKITGLGFPADELTVSTATRSQFAGHFGIEFSHGDKNGHWARFSWKG